jgi:hypothetical protein
MSFEAISWAIEHSRARGAAYTALLVVAHHHNGKAAWPSVKTIAREARISLRQAQRALAKLERSGELSRRRGAGPQGSDLYTLPLVNGQRTFEWGVIPYRSGAETLVRAGRDSGNARTRVSAPHVQNSAEKLRKSCGRLLKTGQGGVTSAPQVRRQCHPNLKGTDKDLRRRKKKTAAAAFPQFHEEQEEKAENHREQTAAAGTVHPVRGAARARGSAQLLRATRCRTATRAGSGTQARAASVAGGAPNSAPLI